MAVFKCEDSAEYRTCGTCCQTKHITEFYKDGHDSDGHPKYRRDCKECYRKARRTKHRGPKRRRK